MRTTNNVSELVAAACKVIALCSLLSFPIVGMCQPTEQVVKAVDNTWIDIQHGIIKNVNLEANTVEIEQDGKLIALSMSPNLVIKSFETELTTKDLQVGDVVCVGKPTDDQSVKEGFTVTDLEILQLEIGNFVRPRDERQIMILPYFIKTDKSSQEV